MRVRTNKGKIMHVSRQKAKGLVKSGLAVAIDIRGNMIDLEIYPAAEEDAAGEAANPRLPEHEQQAEEIKEKLGSLINKIKNKK